MPRVARFNIAAIAELHRQLRYAPEETRRREMDAAEALIDDIDPRQNYPQAFIVYRITGYRPEGEEASTMLVGEALRPDLVNLVQRLSADLRLPSDHEGRLAVPLADVAGRLHVSLKSLQRYRRQGLVCHYVVFPDGERRLARFEDALARFEADHRRQLDRAAAFSRVDADTHAELVEMARTLRAEQGLTLNETALRLHGRCGRAHETVRSILRRHDRRAARPIFSEPGPLTERQVRLMHRAWRFGIPVAALGRHFQKSPATIQRAVNHRRTTLLTGLGPSLDHVILPTFQLPEADEVILAAPAVIAGLDEVLPTHDLQTFLDATHAAPPVDDDRAQALLAAYNLLKARARLAVAALAAHPASEALDAIETRLRWATLVKRRLTCLAVPPAVVVVEQNLHRRLVELPSDRIRALTELSIDVISSTIESVDPGKDQRLTRVCTHALDLALARLEPTGLDTRAAVRHRGGEGLVEPFGRLHAWQRWLDPRRDLAVGVPDLPPALAGLITRRYGWGGRPPCTAAALAEELRIPPAAVSRRLGTAERRLRELARKRWVEPCSP